MVTGVRLPGFSRGGCLTAGVGIAMLLALGWQLLAFGIWGHPTQLDAWLAVIAPALVLGLATLTFRDLLARDGAEAGRVLASEAGVEETLRALQVEARWREDRRQLPLLVGLSILIGASLGYLAARARPYANLQGAHLETIVSLLVLMPAWFVAVFLTSTRFFASTACVLGAHVAYVVGHIVGALAEDRWRAPRFGQVFYTWPPRLLDDMIGVVAGIAVLVLAISALATWARWTWRAHRRLAARKRLVYEKKQAGALEELRHFRLRDGFLITSACAIILVAALAAYALPRTR